MMNYTRITNAVSLSLLEKSHIVIVGAGGSYPFIENLARTGVKKLTVLDIDKVDDTNIVRQGYQQNDIGNYKVDALKKHIEGINPTTEFVGITKNFLEMSDKELDAIFKDADLLLFLTDSFEAQSFGNILALRYLKPAIFAGWYAKSRTGEVFFQIPHYTPACFRCAVSARYQAYQKQDIQITSDCNTIFHGAILDGYIGLLSLAILHRDLDGQKESSTFFKSLLNKNGILNWNFFHLKVHPLGGNPLFDSIYNPLEKHAQNFVSCWQQVEPELTPNYSYDCPDCKGILNYLVQQITNP